MRTRTENDVKLFNEAIAMCTRPVLLVSSDGTVFNMKTAGEHDVAMGLWVKDTRDEMEIFAFSYEDEAIMMDFLRQLRAA